MAEYQSKSERNGLGYMRETDISVLSVGISTGGSAEIKMVEAAPNRHVTATTLDDAGINFTRKLIAKAGLSEQIDAKIEDVSEPLSYPDNNFDYVYARLVLHYLSRDKLAIALNSLYRVTKSDGRLFVVVRSNESDEAKQSDNTYDEATGLTTYATPSGHSATRYFHDIPSISKAVSAAGYTIGHTTQYDEMLNASFDRTGMWVKNNVIELLAKK